MASTCVYVLGRERCLACCNRFCAMINGTPHLGFQLWGGFTFSRELIAKKKLVPIFFSAAKEFCEMEVKILPMNQRKLTFTYVTRIPSSQLTHIMFTEEGERINFNVPLLATLTSWVPVPFGRHGDNQKGLRCPLMAPLEESAREERALAMKCDTFSQIQGYCLPVRGRN